MNKKDVEIILRDLEVRYSHVDVSGYVGKIEKWLGRQKEPMIVDRVYDKLTRTALEYVDIGSGEWEYIGSFLLLKHLYHKAADSRGYDKEDKYGDFYSLIKTLSEYELNGGYKVYSSELLDSYSKEEIEELGKNIVSDRDLLFKYIGLFLLNDRYLAKPQAGEVYELPQERFMIIAMVLMQNETDNRLEKVLESYWGMSNLYMTVATPTLANAGKGTGQLSSCFVDVMEDSIDGIYGVNHDTARVSKHGGGQGIYMGKVRSVSSSIRGVEGVSSGTVPWIKLLNQTAVSVDQLGQRAGAVAIYLDVWHKDIFRFLDLKTNNGDERLKAHDVFTGICVPDLFMEKVEAREDWYLFEGLYTEQYLGFRLEDHYDEKRGEGSFRNYYKKAVEAAEGGLLPAQAFEKVEAIEIMKAILKSMLETGVPYMFYRDEANRMNPNKHQGIIYCSNLCTEIFQNLSPTRIVDEYLTEEGKIIVEKSAGDYVVCNLSSINLPRAYGDNVLERLIPIQVRMLDNVIDVNEIPVLQAADTNKKMRPVNILAA